MLNRASTQEFRWHNNYLKAADNDYPLHPSRSRRGARGACSGKFRQASLSEARKYPAPKREFASAISPRWILFRLLRCRTELAWRPLWKL